MKCINCGKEQENVVCSKKCQRENFYKMIGEIRKEDEVMSPEEGKSDPSSTTYIDCKEANEIWQNLKK